MCVCACYIFTLTLSIADRTKQDAYLHFLVYRVCYSSGNLSIGIIRYSMNQASCWYYIRLNTIKGSMLIVNRVITHQEHLYIVEPVSEALSIHVHMLQVCNYNMIITVQASF